MERATDPCNIKHANKSQFTASSQVQRKPWRPQTAFHQLLHSQWSVVFDCDNGKCGDHFCALESLIISTLMKCLAIKDLGNGVLGHPRYIAVILKIQEEFTCENIREVLMVFSTFGAFLTTESFATVFLIGVDRFLAMHLHLRYDELITPRRIRMFIACSWISSFTTISIDVLFNFQFGEIILLCIGYGSLQVLTIVYIKLFSVARHHAASIHSQSEVATHMSITSMTQKETLPSKFSMYTSFPCCVTVPSISMRRF